MSNTKRALAISALATIVSSNLNAAGFALIENSASGMGNAYAGGAAIAEDASTTYFNPAGLSKIKGNNVIFGVHLISPKSSFTNDGSSLNSGAVALAGAGTTVLSGEAIGGSTNGVVPNFYYTSEINAQWTFGLGITAPFGSATDYSDTWVGRYHATKSEIKTLNINPSTSFKVNEKLSIGFGLNVQKIEATLENKIDSMAVCLGITGNPAPCNGVGLTTIGNSATDSAVSLSGDDWSYGWNFGLLYDISNETRVGLAYRSNVDHKVEGTAAFTRSSELNTLLGASTAFTDTGASVGVDLPETLSISVYHSINPKWAMMADITWTKWSRFDELVVEYDNTAQPTSTIPENWKNSLRYSIGANYQASPKLVYRTGLAVDKTSISSAEDRTPRIPGDDRIWLSFGVGYQTSESFGFDVGYAHLFVSDASINNTDASFGHTLKGDYDASVDIFSAQFNWKF